MRTVTLETLKTTRVGDKIHGKSDVQIRQPNTSPDDDYVVVSLGFVAEVRQFGGVTVDDFDIVSAITTNDDDRPSYETIYSFSEESKQKTCRALARSLRNKLKIETEADIEQSVINEIDSAWVDAGTETPPFSLSFCVEESTARIDYTTKYGDIAKLIFACNMGDKTYDIMATGREPVCTIKLMTNEMVLTELLVVNKDCETVTYNARGFEDLQVFAKSMIESLQTDSYTEESRGRVMIEVIIFEEGQLNRLPIIPFVGEVAAPFPSDDLDEASVDAVDDVLNGGMIKDDSNDRFELDDIGVPAEGDKDVVAVVEGILFDVNIDHQDFSDMRIVRSQISDSVLRVLKLSRLVSINSHYHNIGLEGANIKNSQIYGGGLHTSNLAGANIRKSVFDRCQLININKTKAKIFDVDYYKCDLTDGVFEGAVLVGVTFKKSDMLSMNFDGAVLIDCRFIECSLLGSSFNGTKLINCNTESHVFDMIDLTNATYTKNPQVREEELARVMQN